MRVEYTFDEAKIKENGYSRERIYSALNEEYSKRNFVCSRADDVLTFDSTGHKDDLSTVFILQSMLANSDWFLETAVSYLFYINVTAEPEDFLINIRRLRRKPLKKEG